MLARKLLFPVENLPQRAPHRWASREVFARAEISILCTDAEFLKSCRDADLSESDKLVAREAITKDPCHMLWVQVQI